MMTTTHKVELPSLPALLNAAVELSGSLPCCVIDTREQEALPIRRLPTIRAGLLSGDYSIRGFEDHFAIERKSIPDFVGCCIGDNRIRFEHELHRLRGFDFARLLIIGTEADIRGHNYRSNIEPKAVLHSLYAFEVRYNIPFVFSPTPESGAALVERWAWFYVREQIRKTNDAIRGLTTDPKSETSSSQ
jgi:DNA excision repair protein ERCC-4